MMNFAVSLRTLMMFAVLITNFNDEFCCFFLRTSMMSEVGCTKEVKVETFCHLTRV